jgi:hypothetical protein
MHWGRLCLTEIIEKPLIIKDVIVKGVRNLRKQKIFTAYSLISLYYYRTINLAVGRLGAAPRLAGKGLFFPHLFCQTCY